MIVVLNKKNTTWTFTDHGAVKQTKSGQFYYPEMPLGIESTNKFIDRLVEQDWYFQGNQNYKDFKRL